MPTGIYKRTKRKRKLISFTCEGCGTIKEVTPSYAKCITMRFCSKTCEGFSKRKPNRLASVTCDTCHSIFTKRRDHLSERNYCSRPCASASRRKVDAKWRDPVQIKEYMRTYRATNREKLNSKQYARNAANPTAARARRGRWARANKGHVAALARNRRAKLAGSGGHHTGQQWLDLIDACGKKCLRCSTQNENLQADHIVPVACGGSNNIDNIQPLCQDCNMWKRTRIVDYRPAHLRRELEGVTRESYGRCGLNSSQVTAMRQMFDPAKHTYNSIGKLFHVGNQTAKAILTRQTWTHI